MVKKPTPKVSGSKTSAKPAAKSGGKSAAKSETKSSAKGEFEIGQKAIFIDYADDIAEEEKVFDPGTTVLVVAKETRKGKSIYTVIDPEDADEFKEDPDSVDGSEVIAAELKPYKASAVAKVKEVPKPVEVKAFGDLAKLVKKGDLAETALGLLEDAKKNFFYFGGLLAKIYNENTYAPKGITWIDGSKEAKQAWEDFCVEKFGMGASRVRGYIDVYLQTSSIKGIDIKRVGDIGWSKMAEVARYITDDNADELIKTAEESSIVELKATLKEEYVDAEGRTPSGRQTRGAGKLSKITFSYPLFEDSAASVKYIMEAAQKSLGLDAPEKVFEHIVTEWATDHLDESKVAKAASAKTKVQKEAKKAGVELPNKKKVAA